MTSWYKACGSRFVIHFLLTAVVVLSASDLLVGFGAPAGAQQVHSHSERDSSSAQSSPALVDKNHFQFEQCGPENNYLQRGLTQSPQNNSWGAVSPGETARLTNKPVDQWDAMTRCLAYRSRDRMGKSLKCATEDSPAVTAPQPCLSPEYVAALKKSLWAIRGCMGSGFDFEGYFEALNHEAAFGIATRGYSQWDLGPAQVNTNPQDGSFQKVTEMVQKRAKETGCDNMQKSVARPIDSYRPCSAIAPPENPLRNLFYGAVIYEEKQSFVQKKATDWYQQSGFQGYFDWSASDLQFISRYLTQLGYNTGQHGASKVFRAFVEDYVTKQKARVAGRGPLVKMKRADFERDFPAYVKQNLDVEYIKSESAKIKKREIASQYVNKIKSDALRTQSRSGVSSCLGT